MTYILLQKRNTVFCLFVQLVQCDLYFILHLTCSTLGTSEPELNMDLLIFRVFLVTELKLIKGWLNLLKRCAT